MLLCSCVTASKHYDTSLFVLGLGGTVVYIFANFNYYSVLYQTHHPCTCSILAFRLKASLHVLCGKLIRQAVEGIEGLWSTLHIH